MVGPAGGTGGSGGADAGPCEEGAIRDCHIPIGEHDGILTCYIGTQTCTEGQWGECKDGFQTNKPGVGAGGGTGSNPAALSTPTECLNNPCDPHCKNYVEEPDAGLRADAGGSIYDWPSGRLSDMPSGFVNKGLNEPCKTGLDCQFNMQCTNAATSSSCQHSKCTTGAALSANCDPCVQQICAAKPECCGGSACAHDVCATGDRLAAACSSCVQAVCAAMPSCCTTAWTAACVAQVATSCPTTSCGCDAGELAFNGRCYRNETSNMDWDTARGVCASRGAGWDLVSIDSAAENALVQSNVSVSDTWIGFSDEASEGTWTWSNLDAVTYTNWEAIEPDNNGGEDCTRFDRTSSSWADDDCSEQHDFICEKPAPACPSWSVEVNGSCYLRVTSDRSWTNARDGCLSLGSGWQLVSINDAAENALIGSWVVSGSTWIGLNDRASEGTFVWQNGDAVSYTNWIREPNGGSSENCGNFRRSNGKWRDGSCNAKLNSFCEGPMKSSGGGSGSWTQACVDSVPTLCDAKCGTGDPPAATGTCNLWLPSETDPSCTGIDLALGIGCGSGQIPVCNHGTQPAPSGIRVVHFVGNSTQMPTCTPDMAKLKGSCYTDKPIPPGECVSVTCPNLGNLEELVVNPPGADHVPECSCMDNWTVFKDNTTCNTPECSAWVSEATFKKVNMYIMFDRSGSMAGTKWNGSTQALKAFFQSSSAGRLGVALEFFPLPSGGVYGDGCADTSSSTYTSSSCSAVPCGNPMVPLGTLASTAAPADTQEQALVSAVDSLSPEGWTPSWSALKGAHDWAIGHQTANPNEITVVIFVTDGEPTKCLFGGSSTATNTELANMAERVYLDWNVRTYAIGMQGANTTALDTIAVKGGTGQAFVIGSSNQEQIAADLTSALNAVARQNASCEFALPNQGIFDPEVARVIYETGGTETLLPRRTSSTACGSGWYYDNNTNPTTITLCPSTCTTLQADSTARVLAYLGCPLKVETTMHTHAYYADCPAGTGAQWQYLGYELTRPGDSSVRFRARTATSTAGLASATYATVATAPSSPDSCPLSGPSPCPADIYNALGSAAAKRPYLELEVTVNPTSDNMLGPTVHDWSLTYSCPPNE